MDQKLPMKGFRTVVRVVSGATFQVAAPGVEDIHLRDIAHHLSQANRYNGACVWPYSVARHCIHVASVLPRELALAGLLHDGAEAYLGDVVRPLKVLMSDYRVIEGRYQEVLERRFDLRRGVLALPEIGEADRSVMASEMDSVLLGWHDIVEQPLADIVIEETDWRQDRLSYVVAACLLGLPQGLQEECLETWTAGRRYCLMPRGLCAVGRLIESRESVDLVDRCYRNASGFLVEDRTEDEISADLRRSLSDIAKAFRDRELPECEARPSL